MITERFEIDHHGLSNGRCETAVEGARSENPGGEGRNGEDPLPRSSGDTYVDINDDAARHHECGSHRGQIMREAGHGELKNRRKDTTERAEDPGWRDHLRWRRGRLDSKRYVFVCFRYEK